MREVKSYETKNAIGSQWETHEKTFYTIEFDSSNYLDFYDDEAAWMEALKSGSNNPKRVDSIPNPFKDDDAMNTFYLFCMVFSACGDIKQTFDIIDSFCEIENDGTLTQKGYEPCEAEFLETEDVWEEIL